MDGASSHEPFPAMSSRASYMPTTYLTANSTYGNTLVSSPIDANNQDYIDHGWSRASNSSRTESIINPQDLPMSRSNSNFSWEYVHTPSPRTDRSPEVERISPFSPIRNSPGLIPAQDSFTEDLMMASQNTQPSSQESQHFDLMFSLDQMNPVPAMSLSPQSPAFPYHVQDQQWAPSQNSERINMNAIPDWSTSTTATPLAVSAAFPATNLQMPTTFPPHFNFEDHSIDFEFLDNNPQSFGFDNPRQVSPSSTNSYPQLTPPLDPIDSTLGISPYPHTALDHTIDEKHLSSSLLAQAGSADTSDCAPSPREELDISRAFASSSERKYKKPRIKVETPSRQWGVEGSLAQSISLPSHRADSTKNSPINKKTKARGGREKNVYKLNPQKAQEVRKRREQGACWTCALQRDVCSDGAPCVRCQKRIDRGVLENSDKLCCVREKLYEFLRYFIPQRVHSPYEESNLTMNAKTHIRGLASTGIRIRVQPISGPFPSIACDFFEFHPVDYDSLSSSQYWYNKSSDSYEIKMIANPPITLQKIGSGHDELAEYDSYFTDLADRCIKDFPRFYYTHQRNDFLERLFNLMINYDAQHEEMEFIRSVNKMLVVSYAFGRTALIPSEEQQKLHRLRFTKYCPHDYNVSTVPRMANFQLKHIFLRILQRTMEQVLRRLDRIYRSSKGCKEWTMAFYGVLGLAMTFEDLQNTVHCFFTTDVRQGKLSEAQAARDLLETTLEIDQRFSFMARLFRMKYRPQFNPLRDYKEPAVRQSLGEKAINFVSQVAELVAEKHDEYLHDRQHGPITYDKNMQLYYGRLVAQFLCSFSGLPSA